MVSVPSRSRDFFIFFIVSEPVSKKFGTEKSLGTGLEKIWYRKKSRNRSRKKLVPKKVSEPVSKKFGTEKKSRNRSRSDFGSRHTLHNTQCTQCTMPVLYNTCCQMDPINPLLKTNYGAKMFYWSKDLNICRK